MSGQAVSGHLARVQGLGQLTPVVSPPGRVFVFSEPHMKLMPAFRGVFKLNDPVLQSKQSYVPGARAISLYCAVPLQSLGTL